VRKDVVIEQHCGFDHPSSLLDVRRANQLAEMRHPHILPLLGLSVHLHATIYEYMPVSQPNSIR
jgi:hypothetical protein